MVEQAREWGEYQKPLQLEGSWSAPQYQADGTVVVSDDTGSWMAQLPDEILVYILAMVGKTREETARIALVCRRWSRLTKSGEFVSIFYPSCRGLAKGLLNQTGLLTNLNASIRALDCGQVESKRIGAGVKKVNQWTYTVANDHLLIAVAGQGGIGLWNEQGAELFKDKMEGGISVQFIDYQGERSFLCHTNSTIQLRKLGSSEPICEIKDVVADRVLYVDVAGKPHLAWTDEHGGVQLYDLKSARLINVGLVMYCTEALPYNKTTCLIGWHNGRFAYLLLGGETYRPVDLREIPAVLASQILQSIEYEGKIYVPIAHPPSHNSLASLQLASFGEEVEVSSRFYRSGEEPILQVRLDKEGLIAITENFVIRWALANPNAPTQKPRLKPHDDAVSNHTNLNQWGSFAVEVWQGGQQIDSHYQLASGEPSGPNLSGLLYIEAGLMGHRALQLKEGGQISCFDPSLPVSGEVIAGQLEAKQIIFQQRTLFLMKSHESKLFFVEPAILEEEIEIKQREVVAKSFWGCHGRRAMMTVIGLIGASYLVWMVAENVREAWLGASWRMQA
jgi:F-box-like